MFFFLAFKLFEDFILGHTHSMSILMRAQLACSRVYVCARILQCVTNLCVCVFHFYQAPNSSESPGTSRTEHSDLLEEEDDERSDIKVRFI